MTTPQPYNGASATRLTALINAKNSLSLQYGVDFTLGLPQAYSDSAGRNTKVVLTPTDPTYSTAELHYWRLPLTSLNLLPAGYIQPVPIPSVPFSIHGSLDLINAALGLDLSVNEVQDQTFTEEQTTYPLTILENVSYGWINSDFSFQSTFQPSTGPSNPFIGVRPGWFDALTGAEANYYPVTVGTNTLAAPASETPLSLAPSPSQWWNATGTLSLGGAGGALFDLAVIDGSTGLPAATQPTWSVANNAGFIYPSGTLQGFGYKSIYTDVEATLIVTTPQASTQPFLIQVTGTYEDNSTITATLTIPPSISLGDPMNLEVVPVPGYGLVAGSTAYINKDGKVFTLDPKQYPTLNIFSASFIYPADLIGQTVDSIFTDNGLGVPLNYVKNGTARAWFGGISGAYSSFTVPAGSYIAANDNSAILVLEPNVGLVTYGGTPTPSNVIANMPQGLPSGLTGVNIDANNTSGAYSCAFQEGVSMWAWGTIWNGTAYAPGTETYPDTTQIVYGGLMGFAVGYLDKTGLFTGPASQYPAVAGPPNTQMLANQRLSSVDLTTGTGITADNNLYDIPSNTKVTSTGIYRWAGNGYGSGSVGNGFVVDQYGQLNFKDSSGTWVTVPSTVKAPPGDSYAYQYKSFPSGYAQYTGTVIPVKYRKVLGANGQFVAQGGYTSQVAMVGVPLIPCVTNVFEFNPSYGIASLQPAGAGMGLVLNLDGSINVAEAGNVVPGSFWTSSAELSYKYTQIGTTPNGQSGQFTNSNGWPAIGVQFDGTVTPIGYAEQSLTLASIYTAKKAAWLSMAPANPTIVANLGALLTTAGDVLWWGSTTYGNQNQLTLSDAAYVATVPALVKVCMGTFYCFGLESDGTLHEFDFPFQSTNGPVPPKNIIASLPAGFKAHDVLAAENLIFVISTDKQTGYFMDVSFSTPWIAFTLAAPMVDWSYSAGTNENNWSGAYVTAAGDIHRLTILAGSPMSLVDTPMVTGFANGALMVS